MGSKNQCKYRSDVGTDSRCRCQTILPNYYDINQKLSRIFICPAATADDINIVSLTTSSDFYVLFNNSAIASWIRHIRNVKSITFIGRPVEEEEFWGNMAIHYPQFPTDQTPGTKNSSHQFADGVLPMPTVYWANETHWIEKYMKPYMDENKMPCPYWKVCQQLIKLHVFELSTELGHGYLGDNILIVDSGK
jgi:hypothetical protein